MRPGVAARIRVMVLVGVGYYLGARLGLLLSLVDDNVSALWPPTGISLAAFLIFGRSIWPGVAVAAFAVNLPIGMGPLPALITAVGNTAGPLLAATLLQRVGFRRQLDRKSDALGIVFIGALGSMLVSAVIGAGTLLASGVIALDGLPTAFAVWWTGDAMGVLVVAPFLLSLPLFREQPSWSARQWFEAVCLLVLVTVVVAWSASSQLPRLFLTFPVLGWAAWRLQLRGAAPAALMASLVGTWSVSHGVGSFDQGSLADRMFTLQAFNACVALTSFFLAALVSERNRAARALTAAAAELEERVRQRTAELSSAHARLLAEIRERSEVQERLGLEEARAAHEHEIAERLQRSLLREQFPEIPGISVAARYVPASTDVHIGGDWYDVLPLPGGRIGVAIGDVAGHGLAAAATMAQVRMALRAYAQQDASPVSVLVGVNRLVAQLPEPEHVTVAYLLLDLANGRLTYANAGHPPPLVLRPDGPIFLNEARAAPLGDTVNGGYTEAQHDLSVGSTLVLYTDGLVERRGASLDEGLDRLSVKAMALGVLRVEELSDRLVDALVDPAAVRDDVALVVLRPTSPARGPLHLRVPAEPRYLMQTRASLRQWMRDSGVGPSDESDVLVACGEACANVVRHAYGPSRGELEVRARLTGSELEIVVRDGGAWQSDRTAARPPEQNGGWGLQLMRAVMDTVDVVTGVDGTAVTMRRRVALQKPNSAQSRPSD